MTRHALRTPHAAVIAAAAAVAVALPALANGFAYDDVWIVAQNPAVQTPGDLGHLLTATYWPVVEGQGILWRPVTLAAFALQWAVGGGTPLVFHLVSVALAGLTAGLVALVAGALLGPAIAVIAGLLFAVHPVHVEVTATVVGQAELWAAVGYCGAALAAWRASGEVTARRRGAWIAVTVAAVLFGLGAKEHVVTFPLVLALVWWRRAAVDGRPIREVFRQQAATGVAVVAAIGLYVATRAVILGDLTNAGGIATGLDPDSPWQRLVVMLPVSLLWLRLLFLPVRLSADYGPQHLVPDATFGMTHALAIAIWLLVLAVAWRYRGRSPAVTFGVGWFLATIAIVSNVLAPLEVLLAERLLFLPSAGWAIAVAGPLVAWQRAPRARTLAVGAMAAVMIALGVRSALRAPVWRSNETLFAQMLREAPDSFRTHWALGAQAFARGDSALGEREWREAIRLNPAHPQPIEDLGRLYTRTGRWAAAIPLLERVIALDSSRVGSALALGTAYARTGQLAKADAFLAAMGRRHPAEAMFPALRIDVLRREGNDAGALEAAREAVARDSTQWQLWALAAETAGLAGDCAAMRRFAEEARRRGGAEGGDAVDRILERVAKRKGSCN